MGYLDETGLETVLKAVAGALKRFLPRAQGAESAGTVLAVNAEGNVVPAGIGGMLPGKCLGELSLLDGELSLSEGLSETGCLFAALTAGRTGDEMVTGLQMGTALKGKIVFVFHLPAVEGWAEVAVALHVSTGQAKAQVRMDGQDTTFEECRESADLGQLTLHVWHCP